MVNNDVVGFGVIFNLNASLLTLDKMEASKADTLKLPIPESPKRQTDTYNFSPSCLPVSSIRENQPAQPY